MRKEQVSEDACFPCWLCFLSCSVASPPATPRCRGGDRWAGLGGGRGGQRWRKFAAGGEAGEGPAGPAPRGGDSEARWAVWGAHPGATPCSHPLGEQETEAQPASPAPGEGALLLLPQGCCSWKPPAGPTARWWSLWTDGLLPVLEVRAAAPQAVWPGRAHPSQLCVWTLRTEGPVGRALEGLADGHLLAVSSPGGQSHSGLSSSHKDINAITGSPSEPV